jgi:hypothetical protein
MWTQGIAVKAGVVQEVPLQVEITLLVVGAV